MNEYLVSWEINVDGNTPREAALAALEVMRDGNYNAVVFDVADGEGNVTRVDLLEDEE